MALALKFHMLIFYKELKCPHCGHTVATRNVSEIGNLRIGTQEQLCPKCTKPYSDSGRKEWKDVGTHNKIGHILGVFLFAPFVGGFLGCVAGAIVGVLLSVLIIVPNDIIRSISVVVGLLIAVVGMIAYVRIELSEIRESKERTSEPRRRSQGKTS